MKLRLWRMGITGLIVGVLIAGCRWDLSNFFSGDASDDFLSTGRTLSHFQAVQVDPRTEDTAGPQFVEAADLDGDGRLDLVTAWAQSQPLQFHLQRVDDEGNISFETTVLAGSIPVSSTAGIQVADFDEDGRMDIALLAKSRNLDDATTVTFDGAVIMYFGPEDLGDLTDPIQWQEILLTQTDLPGVADGDGSDPEVGGYTDIEAGDLDGDGDVDLVLALNGVPETEGTEEDSAGSVELFTNPAPSRARRGGEWERYRSPFTAITGLETRASAIKDVVLTDVDRDGDPDVIATRPDAVSMNVRWLNNPVVRLEGFAAEWSSHAIGQVATSADVADVADLDGDGVSDVIVRSTGGRVIQWFKGPQTPALTRNVPWQVYTLAEFVSRTPQGLAVADLDLDGQPEVIAAAEGGIAFFQVADSVYEQWSENLIIDDQPSDTNADVPPTTDPNVAPPQIAGTTVTHSVLVTDLDADGVNDLVITLDRSGLSGLTNDALVWFRNTLSAP